MSDDAEATRRRLVDARARLDADPDNLELAEQVDALADALGALELQAEQAHIAARLETWRRRN